MLTKKPRECSNLFHTVACSNYFEVDDKVEGVADEIKNDIYHTTPEDKDVSMSWEDRQFIQIMEEGIYKNEACNWVMPFPFRLRNVVMPDNREQAMSRLKPQMEKDYVEFLGKVIERGHAELVADTESNDNDNAGNVWYLPHFGVYHAKKPEQIRVVFDSSCEYESVSLNKVLLPGPDLMNSPLGVLMRFRQESVGVICDLEQMFHSFHVDPAHRDLLRFL